MYKYLDRRQVVAGAGRRADAQDAGVGAGCVGQEGLVRLRVLVFFFVFWGQGGWGVFMYLASLFCSQS